MPQSQHDHALRTLGDEDNFRILIVRSTDTVADILDAQSPDDPHTAAQLADMVTASLLLRLTMSPDYRLQTILQNRSVGNIIADSHPDGVTRGLVRLAADQQLKTGDDTYLAIHRSMFGGDVHQGVVETSEGQGIDDVVAGYLHHSEQITSVVHIDHRFDDDGNLQFAGGYLVQLVPGKDKIDDATLAIMTARLDNLPPIDELFDAADQDSEAVADELYGPIAFKPLGENDFHNGCICSAERVIGALSTLSDDDIADLRSDGDDVTVDCDYCGAAHTIDLDDVQRS